MTISSWLCAKSGKNMILKIVHPGGHVELHDRPILAAEIMLRNPRCIVAHPNVFQQPWAIVAPDATLMLGQKFYIVPISTIRKLQQRSFKNSASPLNCFETDKSTKHEGKDDNKSCKGDTCWSNDNCIACFLTGIKIKANRDDESELTRSPSSFGSSETKALTRKRNKDLTGGSPQRLSSLEHWQPNLERIVEE